LSEEDAEVLVVILGSMAKEKNVVYVCKKEIQASENLIHESLEGLGGVT